MAEVAVIEAAVTVESAASDGDAVEAARREAAALAALAEALAALDRFVRLYGFVNSSQEMMVRGMAAIAFTPQAELR